ncbi:MAG TPA: zinc ribbon domain-containing protein [Terriglobales bacterium]|nr:zinc ribbon domain-containing protein [Terriglobales bacterium]
MAHLCQQCGTAIADGTPFCRECRAPQIRVAVAERVPSPSSTTGLAETSPVPPSAPTFFTPPSADGQWSHALRSSLAAGLIGAILMVTPLGVLGLGMLVAGIVAVGLYRRHSPVGALTLAHGAKLGALSGAFGFAFFSAFLAVQVALLHKGDELRSALVHAVEQAAARSSDPQAQAMAAWLTSPEGLGLMVALSLFFTLVLFLILAALGGVLAAMFRRQPGG